jgi:glycosyltransferase involved in cell wall biosynthesis
MTPPAVSVCIPAYRAERFIADAIESVLTQTSDDWELVVIDDASPDRTFEIAQRYASSDKVRISRNSTNLGPVGNWNRVIGEATGRYVKLLCSDDVLYPECLARQAAALDAEPSAGLVAARRDVVDTDGRVLLPHRGLAGLEGLVPGRAALERMVEIGTTPFGEPSIVLFRAVALRQSGPFRDDYATLVDVDRYAAVLRHWDCVALPDTVGAFRLTGGSWSDRSHRVQGRNLRRLLDDLAADPALGLPRSALWRGRLWSYARAPARELVFRVAAWRTHRTGQRVTNASTRLNERSR